MDRDPSWPTLDTKCVRSKLWLVEMIEIKGPLLAWHSFAYLNGYNLYV